MDSTNLAAYLEIDHTFFCLLELAEEASLEVRGMTHEKRAVDFIVLFTADDGKIGKGATGEEAVGVISFVCARRFTAVSDAYLLAMAWNSTGSVDMMRDGDIEKVLWYVWRRTRSAARRL